MITPQKIFKENLPKRDPDLQNFGPKIPTHMGGTYLYPQHVMYNNPTSPRPVLNTINSKRFVLIRHLDIFHKLQKICGFFVICKKSSYTLTAIVNSNTAVVKHRLCCPWPTLR